MPASSSGSENLFTYHGIDKCSIDKCNMTTTDSQAATLQASVAITRAVAALEAGLFCNTPSQSDASAAHPKEALQEVEVQILMLPLPWYTSRNGCGILPSAACLSES